MQTFLDGKVTLYGGDNRDVLKSLPDNSIDSIVTDPPYALVSIVKRFGGANAAPAKGNDAYMRASAGFMNKSWDVGDTVFAETFWAECLRVLKPGGHVVAFSGTRTYHRMAVAIEDAGFEIRDQLAWAYGSGFPKSHDVSKGIDKAAGAERAKVRTTAKGRVGSANCVGKEQDQNSRPWVERAKELGYHEHDSNEPATEAAREWQGWGTALKPAWEPICLARKPLTGTVAANVLEHGTGALNIDGCRVEAPEGKTTGGRGASSGAVGWQPSNGFDINDGKGRWPANIVHDGSDEVLACFPKTTSGTFSGKRNEPKTKGVYGSFALQDERGHVGDSGSAARFFASFPMEDIECTHSSANSAESTFSLSSELVAFALSSAVEQSMPGRALNLASYRAPSMTVTETELRQIAESVITTIQTIGRRFSHESRPEKLTLTDSLASIAAIQSQIDTITITISPLISSGSVEPVTFNITATNSELGAPDSRPHRLFYSSKADKQDRMGSKHPTVKPVDLCQWLCRLVTPPGGVVLDPFAGSGSTGEAAWREGMRCVLIEREEEYQADIAERLRLANAGPLERKQRAIKQAANDNLPLFGGVADAPPPKTG